MFLSSFNPALQAGKEISYCVSWKRYRSRRNLVLNIPAMTVKRR
ncbi:hypothetical protein PY479_12735 [Shewanella sp. A32]|nr:hypothetical protein [Shewanella sp. A32]MDF0535138.1 hypothetical protein [Shewanella sp. A32]